MGKSGSYGSIQWQQTRRRVFKRDKFRCRKCGKAGRLEADHIKPVTQGGEFWDPENIQSLCRTCHIEKTAGETVERRAVEDPQRTAWREFVRELL